MRLSSRQIAVRGRESANLLLSTLQRGDDIPAFLRSYAREYERARVVREPLLYQDLVETLQRESLLTIISRLGRLVEVHIVQNRKPKRLMTIIRGKKATRGKRVPRVRRGAQTQAARLRPTHGDLAAIALFEQEFVDAIQQAMRLEDVGKAEFWRDCELYRKVCSRQGGKTARKSKGSASRRGVSHPFTDRCALVLDASMFEQAREALRQFQCQLDRVAAKALKEVFSARREN